MTRPWPCTGCGSALGELHDGGTVELDTIAVQIILTPRGAVVICLGCHARREWHPEAATPRRSRTHVTIEARMVVGTAAG